MREQYFFVRKLGLGNEVLSLRFSRRLRFSSDADIVRLTNARIIIIIIISLVVMEVARAGGMRRPHQCQ